MNNSFGLDLDKHYTRRFQALRSSGFALCVCVTHGSLRSR